MLLFQNDYKGKWFVLSDDDDSWYGSWGTINSENITELFLIEHATNCLYYGIPMYTGENKDFQLLCDQAMDFVEKKDKEMRKKLREESK